MWFASLALGILSWSIAAGWPIGKPDSLEVLLLRLLITCYTSPAGLTLATASWVRGSGPRPRRSELRARGVRRKRGDGRTRQPPGQCERSSSRSRAGRLPSGA